MTSDHWTWATPRPAFMREIEPLARRASWPSPPKKPQPASILAYRALTNERLREAEVDRQAGIKRAGRDKTLELNSKRKGEAGDQPERQTA